MRPPFFSPLFGERKEWVQKKRVFRCGGNRKKRADRVVRPYGCSGRSEKRADRVVRPYGCGGKS